MDLSVLIPSRNEEHLARTIACVLRAAQAETEVIAVLDGEWADPPVPDDPRVRLTHSGRVIGQRAATNLAARMSEARYVMKLDAHCDVEDGFDRKLLDAADQLEPGTVQIPAMYNLHAFNWRCEGCGAETYQGPTPTACEACAKKGAGPGGPFTRVMYWDRMAGGVPGRHVRTESWVFDSALHFQYGKTPAARTEGDVVDVMSSVGAAFFMSRARFFEIGGLDEAHGSWGQFGTEVACKAWLSGGRHVVNRTTWFAHLFRTQGAGFGFPYPQSPSGQERAREHSRALWLGNAWPGQRLPLSWLVERFAPVPGWHKPRRGDKTDNPALRASRLAAVVQAGESFRAKP